MNDHNYRINDGDAVKFSSNCTEIERKIYKNRAERNNLLQKSDSKVLSDRFKKSKIDEWKTYRQALRDLDFSDPDSVSFPSKPE